MNQSPDFATATPTSFFLAPSRLGVSPACLPSPRGEQVRRLNVRRGLTLLEVLVSVFVLTLGMLGVAMLIPIGKMAMIETNKSDRTGACGRAGLRDVKVRRMLDANTWFPATLPANSVFVIDPLGYAGACGTVSVGGTASGVARMHLRAIPNGGSLTATQADQIFSWHDDLTYVQARDDNTKPNGERPMPVTSGGAQQDDGNFSWFLTVAASPGEVAANLTWPERRQFSVSVVVCWKRAFTYADNDPNAGETTVSNVKCDSDTGLGGIGIEYTGSTVMPKENQWVLLSTNKQTTWYRVVSVGNDGTDTRATLVGPDWYGGGDGNPSTDVAKLIVIKGVTGVYTTTVQLDNDGIWSK